MKVPINERPIGVFDSGLGGLTVVRAIRQLLPEEHIVFLGDTARVPYGSRTAETVVKYARGCVQTLAHHNVKIVIAACNTVSAVAMGALGECLDVPVLGVIDPGSQAAFQATKNKHVGVIATMATISSGAYENALVALEKDMQVFTRPAALLVPLIEEGWLAGAVPEAAITRYVESLVDNDIDTLVLGCTHYPIIRHTIQVVLDQLSSQHITIVDSADATAACLKEALTKEGLHRNVPGSPGKLQILATDTPSTFKTLAGRFLSTNGADLEVECVDIAPPPAE